MPATFQETSDVSQVRETSSAARLQPTPTKMSPKSNSTETDELLRPKYPTGSLDFLKALQNVEQTQNINTIPTSKPDSCNNPARVCLHVLVVGAGLGGLAAAIALARRGHTVEVLEQTAELGEVGAGIQIPPNSSRLLLDWGLGEFLGEKVVEPDAITIRRWQDGEPIGLTRLIPDFRTKFNAPYYVVHRAHFHDAMHRLALRLGVVIKVDHRVVDYCEEKPSVTLSDGRVVTADLIVAADGLKSIARKLVPGQEDNGPQTTGFAVYRATVDVKLMENDSGFSHLLRTPGLHLWLGEDRHVMTYTIAGGRSFNMVLSHIDRTDPANWSQRTALEDMRKYFEGWDPNLVKLINLIPKTLKWPISNVPTRSSWLSRSKKLVLLGDAVHAMVPYMSQGAAMAVEDGAALAEALSYAQNTNDLARVLEVFERVRAERSGQMQQASLINGKLWHFADGLEQEARDLAMRPEVAGDPFDTSPNQWSDPLTQQWAYGYDAVRAIAAELQDAIPARL